MTEYLLRYYLKKEKGENELAHFRFLSAKKLTTPMTQATATAISMATSFVISGISAACVGSVGSGSVGSGVVGSGVVGSGAAGSGAARLFRNCC